MKFRLVHLLIPLVLVWVSYAQTYYSSLFAGKEQFSWIVIFVESLVFVLLWMVAFYFIRRRDRQGRPFNVSFILCLIIGLALLHLSTYMGLKQLAIYAFNQDDYIKLIHIIVILTEGLLIASIIGSIQYYLFFQAKWLQEKVVAADLAKANSKAQLNALQTQVSPHFLFNNLNTLQSLIDHKNEKAQDFLLELSDLYRYLLEKKDTEIVSLREELDIARKFGFLMHNRYGDNFNCTFQIDESLLDTRYIPPFSLQLLLENVVKHNRIDDQYPLTCYIYTEGESIIVKNRKSPKSTTYPSNKIGLSNLQERYSLLSNQQIEIQDEEQQFMVELPLLKIEHHH